MSRYANRRRSRSGGKSTDRLTGLLLIYADFLLGGVILLVATCALAIAQMNPPANAARQRARLNPVALVAQIKWQNGEDFDIWEQCFMARGGDVQTYTVGYLRLEDGPLTLSNDEQGFAQKHWETISTTSQIAAVPPNTACRINVALFAIHSGSIPATVNVTLVQNFGSDDEAVIAATTMTFTKLTEMTAITAAWDDKGKIIPESVQTSPSVPTVLIATRRYLE